jgi:hypothetical protein
MLLELIGEGQAILNKEINKKRHDKITPFLL